MSLMPGMAFVIWGLCSAHLRVAWWELMGPRASVG